MANGRIFCGVSEKQLSLARRRLLKWNKRHLRWYIADRLPGVSLGDQRAAYRIAFENWQAVCGLTFEETRQREDADFIILTRPIDGRNGTLAEHELPPGDDRPLRGWFDTGDSWDPDRPLDRGKIDLVAVATHEFGHGIGIGHLRTPNQLMNPYYTPAITTPQDADIAEAVARYGGPQADPTPTPTPDPPTPRPDPTPTPTPEQIEITVKLGGATYGGLTLDRQR